MQNNQKQYGLIKLGKGVQKPIAKPSIFGSDSESEDDGFSTSAVKYESSNLRKQTQAKISKAIEEDPNIFQYDEVYEEMKSSTTKPTIPKAEKKPRYMTNLLKTAEIRKKEHELRQERKIQKEREQEGDEFKDKEAFVTTAYREKLEEMKKEQEDAECQDARESVLDVTKQNNLNGFYRSLYKNTIFNNNEDETKQESVSFNKKTKDRKINLRERKIDENDDQDEDIDSDDNELQLEKDPIPNVAQSDDKEASLTTVKDDLTKVENKNLKHSEENNENKTKSDVEVSSEAVEESVKIPKLSRNEIIRKIFTKRTVGQVYDEARQRYLERKASSLLVS